MYYAAGILSLMGLAAAAWFSILLARADREFRKGTPEGVARAVELTPRNTAYLSRRALQIEYDGGDARPMLERMAALNPTASAPRIRLGLDAEIRGDFETAQRWLLDAARVDRQFEPAWTLANFYFRQQRTQEFWAWMRTALEVSYGDRRPAFDLCWNVTSDGQEILSRAIPDRREVVSAYLSYLLQEHRLSEAAAGCGQAGWVRMMRTTFLCCMRSVMRCSMPVRERRGCRCLDGARTARASRNRQSRFRRIRLATASTGAWSHPSASLISRTELRSTASSRSPANYCVSF